METPRTLPPDLARRIAEWRVKTRSPHIARLDADALAWVDHIVTEYAAGKEPMTEDAAVLGATAFNYVRRWATLCGLFGHKHPDAERLDWLDGVNRKANERNGTTYGWRFDLNHNRAALTDNRLPALSVRDAIDRAMQARRTPTS